MEQIFGKGVSKGVAAGPISFYRRASGVIPRHEVSDTAAELERFRAARETAKEQLAKLYIGKTVLLDHVWSAKSQTARIYNAYVSGEGDVKRLILGQILVILIITGHHDNLVRIRGPRMNPIGHIFWCDLQ